MSTQVRGAALRSLNFTELAEVTSAILLDPSPRKASTMTSTVEALDKLREGWEALRDAVTTSSYPVYARRDLPPEEQRSYAQFVHNLKVLRTLYAPGKEEPQ